MTKINLFYEQPEFDRWFTLDRYPRRVVRRIVRGKSRPGGHDLIFMNLKKGLDQLGIGYRVNGYGHLRNHPGEIACVIGKPHVLDKVPSKTPVLFGAAQFSHPNEQPGFFEKHRNIRLTLVPGEWVRAMWEPVLGDRVRAWPVGIDTTRWAPNGSGKTIDVLLYDKVRWEHAKFERTLINPILDELRNRNLAVRVIRYGFYAENEFHRLLQETRAMIFLCEHETQGIAYQQALSNGVPILAWDRGGYWQDPNFYPRVARYEPVTSVPYWDERCGLKFKDASTFARTFEKFWAGLGQYAPRAFILENLTLEKCAAEYLQLVKRVEDEQ